jgi:hypothetical protein
VESPHLIARNEEDYLQVPTFKPPVFRGKSTGDIQLNLPAAHDRGRSSASYSPPHQRSGIDAKPKTAFEFILKCTAAGHHESQEPIVRHAAGLLNVESLKD